MKRLIRWLAFYAAAFVTVSLAMSSVAMASTVIDLISFKASGFVDGTGHLAPPKDPVTGSFGLIFDPAQTYSSETLSGLAVFSPLNITVGQIAFTYDPGRQDGFLTIGGTISNIKDLASNTNDFAIVISHVTTSPFVVAVAYSVAGSDVFFSRGSKTVHIQQLASAQQAATTPIPGTLPLLASGMLVLGGCVFMKRHRMEPARRGDSAKDARRQGFAQDLKLGA